MSDHKNQLHIKRLRALSDDHLKRCIDFHIKRREILAYWARINASPYYVQANDANTLRGIFQGEPTVTINRDEPDWLIEENRALRAKLAEANREIADYKKRLGIPSPTEYMVGGVSIEVED